MSSSSKPKRERNPEATRRRILDAAEAEFARKGYDGTRLRDVALTVGVHHALLHHYFKDKEGLFRAVVERAIEGMSARAGALLRQPGDLRELTEAFVNTTVDFLAENQNLALILHFASLDEGSPAFAVCEEIGFRLVKPLMDGVREAIRSGQRTGTLRTDVDANQLLVVTLGAVAFVYHSDRLIRGLFNMEVRTPEAITAHKRAAVRVILDGVMTGSRAQGTART